MKAIMISIKPKQCANILNLIQTLIVSKTCPKDWKDYLSGKTNVKPEPREVYIYCTKDKNSLRNHFTSVDDTQRIDYPCGYEIVKSNLVYNENYDYYDEPLNGKVIAKFTMNKCEMDFVKNVCDRACLTEKEVRDYLDGRPLYAWHINNLVIFDKHKELSEFKRCTEKTCIYGKCHKYMHCLKPLTKAPQSYQFIEVDE